MSFLHSHSCECAKSELDLFTIPPTQTSIEESQWLYYNPTSSLSENSPIEFVVPGQGEEYIDLAHTMIRIRAKIIRDDNTAVISDNVGPVNNFLHSMFNQIDVYFNQKLVSTPNNTYAYRAYLETLLNYGNDAKATHLTMGLWSSDTAGNMNAVVSDADDETVDVNEGFVERCKYTKGGKQFEMMGHLHCDVFNQDKFLVNGVEMKLRMIRSKESFCLMDASTGNSPYKLQIQEAALLIRRVKISPGILLAHAKALSKTTAKYPTTRVEVKSFIMQSGIFGGTIDNVVLGQLPKRVIIGFVDNRAFNGDRSLNPFDFANYNVNFLCLYVDGKQVPGKPLQPKFDKSSYLEAEAYHTLFSGTGVHFLNEGFGITREEYAKGYCLYAFDLTPDLSAHCASHWNLVKHGSLRIEARFDLPTPTSLNCLVYAEYDNILEIDSSRQVIVDFSV